MDAVNEEFEVVEVNDTDNQNLSENDDTFEMPTIDPETMEVVEEGSNEGNWEKRYKDLQSQKDKEVSEVKHQVDRYKKLLTPFEKDIKERDGDLVFEFPDTPRVEPTVQKPKEEDESSEIRPPTDDDWAVNPTEAAEKLFEYKEHQRQMQDNQRRETEARENAKVEYESSRAKAWVQAQELYPDVSQKDSALYKRADEILKSDPNLHATPSCDLIAVKLAAQDLGILPAGKKTTKKDTSYIVSGKTGTGTAKGSGKLSESEFAELTDEEQQEYFEREVLGK